MEKEFKSKFGNKVMLNHAWNSSSDTSIWYTVACHCGSDDHNISMVLEYDKSINMLVVNFYKSVNYSAEFSYKHDSDTLVDVAKDKVKIIWKRIKDATILLFTGNVEMEADFILQEPQHIQDFIDAMIEGREYCLGKNLSNVRDDLSVDQEPGC
jgi:hypothetical protein